jgi:hypothetical protein
MGMTNTSAIHMLMIILVLLDISVGPFHRSLYDTSQIAFKGS